MNRWELQGEVMKVIYNAKWQVTLSGGVEYSGFDEFYIVNEDDVFDKITKLLGVKMKDEINM